MISCRGSCSEFQFSRDLYSILCQLAEQSLEKETPAEESVRRAVAYIRRHYAEPLSVQDIAESVSLSPYYFTRLFKRIMMTSPHLYLLNHRLAEAKEMLVYTRDKIDRLSEQLVLCPGVPSGDEHDAQGLPAVFLSGGHA